MTVGDQGVQYYATEREYYDGHGATDSIGDPKELPTEGWNATEVHCDLEPILESARRMCMVDRIHFENGWNVSIDGESVALYHDRECDETYAEQPFRMENYLSFVEAR